MCFEWDKRYFRELEEKKSREKLDEVIRQAEEAASLARARSEARAESVPVAGRDVKAVT